MTDEQARTVSERVDRYLADRDAGVELHRRFEYVIDCGKFQAIVEKVRPAVPPPPAVAPLDLDLEMVVAMCLLGPTGQGPPPAHLRDALLTVITAVIPAVNIDAPEDLAVRHDRLKDIIIAFGCGNWRQAQNPPPETWFTIWAEAAAALAAYAQPAVNGADHWLRRIVPGLNQAVQWGAALFPYADLFIADLLIAPTSPLQLLQGECFTICNEEWPPGSRFVFSVGPDGADRDWGNRQRLPGGTEVVVSVQDSGFQIAAYTRVDGRRTPIRGGGARFRSSGGVASVLGPADLTRWRCGCGNVHCPDQHRLSSWNCSADPYVPLKEFVRRAVMAYQMAGSFAVGMYGALLSRLPLNSDRGERLRLVNVGHRVCTANTLHANGMPNYYFMETSCPLCQTPFDPAQMPFLDIDRLILEQDPPSFQPAEYCRCPSCAARPGNHPFRNNLYEITGQMIQEHPLYQALANLGAPLPPDWGEMTPFQQAHYLENQRQGPRQAQLAPIPVQPWCPLCQAGNPPPADPSLPLPRNTTTIWVWNPQQWVELDPQQGVGAQPAAGGWELNPQEQYPGDAACNEEDDA